MQALQSDAAWEAMFAPYDQLTYQAVLDRLGPNDIVLDIGAGDLRCSRQMACIVKKVYALEIDARVLAQANTSDEPPAENLIAICADARRFEVPLDVTTGVLLMRHCTCFRLYAEKLRKAGANRLITNARWRMGVETVDLRAQRKSFAEAEMGWYACWCGRTGFKEGPAENWSFEKDEIIHEVTECPNCVNVPPR